MVTNSGTIFGTRFGVSLESDVATLINRGTIGSDSIGVDIDGAGATTVVNDGTITGAVQGIRMRGSGPSIL
jgi:hypothetical protein